MNLSARLEKASKVTGLPTAKLQRVALKMLCDHVETIGSLVIPKEDSVPLYLDLSLYHSMEVIANDSGVTVSEFHESLLKFAFDHESAEKPCSICGDLFEGEGVQDCCSLACAIKASPVNELN